MMFFIWSDYTLIKVAVELAAIEFKALVLNPKLHHYYKYMPKLVSNMHHS
jgi:hypothetical protein